MSTPTSRGRWLRGAMVGACSALVTLAAHSLAGGAVPRGGALMVAVLACGTAGAAVGGVPLASRLGRLMGVVTSLSLAQLLGHVVLAMAAGHHHTAAPTVSMLAAHAGAALVIGVAITSVEYLYVVGASVLCWLRLFFTAAARPTSQVVRRATNPVVAHSAPLLSGRGLRGPPRRLATAT